MTIDLKAHQAREAERIAAAYSKRSPRRVEKYSNCIRLERERFYASGLATVGPNLARIRLLEVGCGDGSEIERLIGIGLHPANCAGVELLEDRYRNAVDRLPDSCELRLGDACCTDFDDSSFDVVFASTVFTSILDDAVQEALANEMWRVLKPGGNVLWYDFVYDNPRNPDVRGVRRSRILELFPEADAVFHRVTLAPPIGRRIAFLGATGYRIFNSIPLLRTHLVGWLQKSRAEFAATEQKTDEPPDSRRPSESHP